jgi:uncharacterized protein YjiS (DUF1127 family)
MSTLRTEPATLAVPAISGERLPWRDLPAMLVEQLLVWHERARQRHQLRGLSDHMLRDMGLGRGDVEAEAAKPFWRG